MPAGAGCRDRGALFALRCTGGTSGDIFLYHVSVNDSIVLVDTINRLRREGMPLVEAVTTGARTRLRAVLVTSITTISSRECRASPNSSSTDSPRPTKLEHKMRSSGRTAEAKCQLS